MKKWEIIQALKKGKKVKHVSFPEEWVKQIPGGYEFKDGVKCDTATFWMDRNTEEFNAGWTVVDD